MRSHTALKKINTGRGLEPCEKSQSCAKLEILDLNVSNQIFFLWIPRLVSELKPLLTWPLILFPNYELDRLADKRSNINQK